MALNIGMEYELENASHHSPPQGWVTVHEESLRDAGVEFVFDGPTHVEGAMKRVQRLLSTIRDDYTISERCSSHVHIDIRGLSTPQRVIIYCLLVAYEDVLYAIAGGDRKRSNFCVPTLYTPCIFDGIDKVSRTGRDSTDTKYTGINTMCVGTIGSLELRHFQPLVDENELKELFVIISAIYKAAAGCKLDSVNRSLPRSLTAAFNRVALKYDVKEESRWVTAALQQRIG